LAKNQIGAYVGHGLVRPYDWPTIGSEYWAELQGFFDTITFGIIPDWSDDDVADWDGISKSEITNARRIEFAKGRIDRTAEDHTGFDAMKVSTSNGEPAYVIFEVRIFGQSGPVPECFGVFRNLREFWKRFKDDGWLDTSKISNRRILELWSKKIGVLAFH
jgi:hypothetical protein